MATSVSRVEALERELALVRKNHASQLREIAAAAGLREAHAMSIVACKGKGGGSEEPNGGPGASPGANDANDCGSRAPPRGADDPSPSPTEESCPTSGGGKLTRWLSRAKKEEDGSSTMPEEKKQVQMCDNQQSSGKLGRWLSRSKKSETITESTSPGAISNCDSQDNGSERGSSEGNYAQSEPETSSLPAGGKLNRWLARASKPVSCPAAPTSNGSWQAEGGNREDTEAEQLVGRIRDSWAAVDAALNLLGSNGSPGLAQGPQPPVCAQCGGGLSGDERCTENHNAGHNNSPAAQSRGLGLRVEETRRGLCVTHVVPGGMGDDGGVQVEDIIKLVDGQRVTRLKDLAGSVRGTGEACFEVQRGRGSLKSMHKCFVTRASGSDETPDNKDPDGGNQILLGADVLLQTFLKARRNDKEMEGNGGGSSDEKGGTPTTEHRGEMGAKGRGARRPPKYNKYGKDTQLWIPASDDLAGEVGVQDGKTLPNKTEVGGFFMFPPGHPDHVPLPPGEAALIAGRSDVHPKERLAPHWSHIVFKAPTGAEIRAQARHATYGTIEPVSGKLVPADPITAHTNLTNATAVSGSIAYVKRGGAPFTKKARVAVAAGAVACVVANLDRETFGMSFTEDGLPFEALNIPCVMISSDIASKLEVSDEWTVSLVPARPDQQGSKRPPTNQPNLEAHMHAMAAAAAPENNEQSEEQANGAGKRGGKLLPNGLKDLKDLPLTSKPGVNIGRPGKKPTMWKKIKLFLP